jgi:adenine-specific DNA-methyltransferase
MKGAAKAFREEYLLRYLLDVNVRGSSSLLDVRGFREPDSYRLSVRRPGSDEAREMHVDLVETFNWLIGIAVRQRSAKQRVTAAFRRISDPDLPAGAPTRLQLDGELSCGEGPWWFRTVSGTLPDGREGLVIWRNRPGGDEPAGIEQDNLVLDEWFRARGYSGADAPFDVVYVNGAATLGALKPAATRWTVRLIEDDFHRLMFATSDT